MTDRLLAGADQDLVQPLAKRIGELFHGVHLETTVAEMNEQQDGVRVRFEGDEAAGEENYDQVLVAVGRKPNSEQLGLDQTEVECDEKGFITVDDRRRTSDERISAIGDVAGGMLLAHEAMHEGQVAVESIAGQSASFDPRAIPAVVYTDPQIAWCGLTEAAAKEEGRKVQVTRFPWRASGRALTLGASTGMTKLLSDPESGRILGVGIVGRDAESMIGQGVVAIEMAAVTEDLARSIAAHPTVSETVHEAAQAALGRPLHSAPDRNA
jgi:dihydrolipoamide dehydrogenase